MVDVRGINLIERWREKKKTGIIRFCRVPFINIYSVAMKLRINSFHALAAISVFSSDWLRLQKINIVVRIQFTVHKEKTTLWLHKENISQLDYSKLVEMKLLSYEDVDSSSVLSSRMLNTQHSYAHYAEKCTSSSKRLSTCNYRLHVALFDLWPKKVSSRTWSACRRRTPCNYRSVHSL